MCVQLCHLLAVDLGQVIVHLSLVFIWNIGHVISRAAGVGQINRWWMRQCFENCKGLYSWKGEHHCRQKYQCRKRALDWGSGPQDPSPLPLTSEWTVDLIKLLCISIG